MANALDLLREIGLALRGGALRLALWMGVCMGCGLAYTVLKAPEYSASVRMMMQPGLIAVDDAEDVRQFHQIDLDNRQTETDLDLILSESVLRSVFAALKLENAPELQGSRNGLWSAVFTLAHDLAPGSAPQTRADHAFDQFKSRVRAMRLRLSYVLDVTYRANNAAQAARVANAIAAAFVQKRLQMATASRVAAIRLNRSLDSIQGETMRVAQAVRSGSLPTARLPDSDVRFIGEAVTPLSKAFPKTVPVMLLAAALGLVSGLLAIIVLHLERPSPASQRQKLVQLRIECLHLAPPGGRLRSADRLRRRRRTWRTVFPLSSLRVLETLIVPGDPGRRLRVLVIASRRVTSRLGCYAVSDLLAQAGASATVTDFSPGADPEAAATPGSARVVAAVSDEIRGFGLLEMRARFDVALMVVEPYRTPLPFMSSVARFVQATDVHLFGLVISK